MVTLFFLFVALTVSPERATGAARVQLRVVFTMQKDGYGDVIGPAVLGPIQRLEKELNVDVNWTIMDTQNKLDVIVPLFYHAISHFKPHAIIGETGKSACNMLGTLAAASDTLYMSIDCNPIQFISDGDEFPTYVSVKSSMTSLGLIINKLMDQFGWTRVALVGAPHGPNSIRMLNVKMDLTKKNRQLFVFYHAQPKRNTWEEFLKEAQPVKDKLKHLAERSTLFVFMLDLVQTEDFLKTAQLMGLMNGRHAFIINGLIEDIGLDSVDMKNFEGVITVDRVLVTDTPEWKNFETNVSNGFDSADWKSIANWTRAEVDTQSVTWQRKMIAAGMLNDDVLLWLNTLSKARDEQPSAQLDVTALNGSFMARLAREMSVEGVTGKIVIKDGLPEANWTVNMIQSGKAKVMYTYEDGTKAWTDKKPGRLVWPGRKRNAPREPRCFADKCLDEWNRFLIIICCSLVALVVIILFTALTLSLLWRRLQEKQMIYDWRITWTDVTLMSDTNTSANSSLTDRRSEGSSRIPLHITAGMYKGTMIAIKEVKRDSVRISELAIYSELKQLLHVKHENINAFVGVCVDAPNVCVAMAYAEKGSIQNVLADSQFDIDWEFRMSLALDVANGMEYLHGTPVGAHGHLTSANCVIDERWVCKISDYGLKLFRCIPTLRRPPSDLLWTAPEILRKKISDAMRVHGTKPGDVYSFGIILSELLTRELPYQSGMETSALEELLAKVKMSLEPPFRPTLPPMEGHIAGEWIALAKNCWQTVPSKRPTFRVIKSILLANHSGKFTNVLERMQMMLEESIERANTDLLVERRKTETMLENILPKAVVEKVTSGAEFEPQLTDSVVLCLCDTLGIVKATRGLPADVVVDVLKSLYRQYDEIAEKYGAFEICTSGGRDAMMLTGGLPVNAKVDAEAICTMSLELLSFISTFKHPRIQSKYIQMKTTIHTGSAYSVVMGKQIPQFHVFGDVIPSTTHLHSVGSAMMIRISSATRDLLRASSGFKIQRGDDVLLKGSLVSMYFVTGKEGFTMPLPASAAPPPTVRRRSSAARRRSSSASRAPTEHTPSPAK